MFIDFYFRQRIREGEREEETEREREKGRQTDRQTSIGCLLQVPLTGIEPTTYVFALTGDPTHNSLVYRKTLQLIETPGQGKNRALYKCVFKHEPWLVWLSGLSASLGTKESLVRFPVMAYAWVVGQVPTWERVRGNHTLMFLSLSFSLPSPL